MYYDYFGLERPPFKITPDTAFFFEGGNRGATLDALLYAIAQGEGIIKVTGEVGSGKTMLCRVVLNRLDQNVDVVYLANPSVAPDEILHAIAFELAIRLPGDTSRVEVLHALQSYLVSRHAKGHQVVLFVEEAQRMPLETLEEIRLLSNLETGEHKLLQIVLFGQPELDVNLRQPHIRQLRERITCSFDLSPLSAPEIAEYLAFRLRAAGYHGPALFSRPVVDLIAQASKGLTRRVNIIADKALLAAFADGTHTVTARHVRSAIADSEFSRGGPSLAATARGLPQAWRIAGGIVLLLAVAAAAAWLAWPQRQPAPEATAESETVAPPPPAAQPSPPPAAPAGAAPQGAAAAGRSQPASREAVVPTTPGNAFPRGTSGRARSLAQWISMGAQRLRDAPTDGYTIQLMAGADADYLQTYLSALTDSVESDMLIVYRSLESASGLHSVVYGTFTGFSEAVRALDSLPPELSRYRPYVRSLRVVRAESEAAAGVGVD
jgi:type II secretory pathway predicted ATPase ExeA